MCYSTATRLCTKLLGRGSLSLSPSSVRFVKYLSGGNAKYLSAVKLQILVFKNISLYCFLLHPLSGEHIQISKLQISLKSLNIFLFNVSKHFKQLTFVEDFERYFSATNVVLQSRANVYMKNRGGFTALHLCCQVSFTFYKCTKKVSLFTNAQRKFHFSQIMRNESLMTFSPIFNFWGGRRRPDHYLAPGVGLAVNQI